MQLRGPLLRASRDIAQALGGSTTLTRGWPAQGSLRTRCIL